jgi:hypothetical protein
MSIRFWLIIATCVLLSSCKSSAYEAFCYSSSYESAESGNTTVSYPCYASLSKCQKRQSEKSKAAADFAGGTMEVGPCEKTGTIHCAEPTSEEGYRVCGPSHSACEEVAAQARESGQSNQECKSMSGEQLERMRKDEQARRRSKGS